MTIDHKVPYLCQILLENGKAVVTKIAIDPVWWLPGVA